MPTEMPHKKQLSERRRQQNKQAQKNYRERQKRNLQLLQDLAGSRTGFVIDQAIQNGGAVDAESKSCSSSNCLDAFHHARLMHSDPHVQLNPIPESPLNPHPGYKAPLHLQVQGSPTREHVHGQSPPSGKPQTDVSMIPSLHDSTQSRNNNGSLVQIENDVLQKTIWNSILEGKYTLEEILKAGVKALSQESSIGHELTANHPLLRTDQILVLQNVNPDPASFLPDIRRNNIRIKQVMWAAACVQNAIHLGLSPDTTHCENAKSPFFRQSVSEDVAKDTCLNSFEELKEHLRPVPIQLMHQHHPYIDVLPFPTFRERIIKLVYADTPMIDEDDLCNDLENDGIICWGSSLGGGSIATGSGAPWDIRSWEAQPWFLRKWWILIGGVDGELYKQTQWWCEMRGERSCYPW